MAMPAVSTPPRIHLARRTADSILVGADTAFSLGIVLTELVTNAVKYAFPPPRSGTILVQARRSSTERIEVLIRDDGIGMTSLREGSLGYGLVRSLVQQIEGKLDIRTDAGLPVTISFPASWRPVVGVEA